jgi:glycosyltransferase involved in cell wall biosynthesis
MPSPANDGGNTQGNMGSQENAAAVVAATIEPALRERTLAAAASVALLTGGFDRHYATDLSLALVHGGARVEFVGSDELDSAELRSASGLTFLNLHGNRRPDVSAATKVWRVLRYYARVVRYAATAEPRVFHILWNAKLDLLDRTLLMLYYRLLGKKIVLTAHNVNAARRDGRDSLLNRLTLRIQYRLAHHIFVHTTKMKRELTDDFGVPASSVTVIRHPVNSAVPSTEVTPAEAKARLGIEPGTKTILFFGSIRPYKGLEYLTAAFQQLVAQDPSYRLLLAAEPKKDADDYLRNILQSISAERERGQILQRLEFIPDEDTELYFKAADVLALPYTDIFQSGVLFLAYTFGLPVVATDVGSFREDIVEGETGFICRPRDAADLAGTLEAYFRSDLFANLERRRGQIQALVNERHSWTAVGEATRAVYARLMAQ